MIEGTPTISTARQQKLLADFKQLVAERMRDEVEIKRRAVAREEQAKLTFETQRAQARELFEREQGKLIGKYRKSQEDILVQYETIACKLLTEEENYFSETARKFTENIDAVKGALIYRTQQIQDNHTLAETAAKKEYQQFETECAQRAAELEALLAEAEGIVRRRCRWPESKPTISPPPTGLREREYLGRVAASIRRSQESILALKHLASAKFLEDGWPVLILIFTAIATLAALIFLGIWSSYGPWVFLGCLLLIPAAAGLLARQIALPIARIQTLQVIPLFQQAIGNAHADLEAAQTTGKANFDQWQAQLVTERDAALQKATEETQAKTEELTKKYQARKVRAREAYGNNRASIVRKNEGELAQLTGKFPPRIEKLEQDFVEQFEDFSRSYREQLALSQEIFSREWDDLARSWQIGVQQFAQEIAAMNDFCNDYFPAWESVDWNQWQPRSQAEQPSLTTRSVGEAQSEHRNLPALRFGQYEFDLKRVAGAVPAEKSLQTPETIFTLPAVLSYPESPSLFIEAEDEGRDVATSLLQDVMLRMLAAFPPGKVKFTIIDPVGLGQNFSAFMHLADYDDRLVTNRIWTEGTHINQRLLDLTEHMEKVIQKYLRNEFASILDYNQHAGEVAEPFQILVIANFPANFSEEAARRLASIAHSGARCGVYTLIATDNKLKMPRTFDLADLRSQATSLLWDAESKQFRWQYDDLQQLPLKLERPPADDSFTAIVKTVGKLAKDASKVEVPFESIVPPPSDWWTFDSRSGVDVPLGRAGAKKFQYMRLGKGTSQHVLISGKTGSGKSTLLNALITNLAIHYSPEELNFYLIDFKKGVEFKAYAAHRLPHARVIAIESEREFGMSVLERLDQELKRRGDLFRQYGVQDVKGYRSAVPDSVMPRILLIIDEFQEFFTSDDKISHDSALLLDRLVRQGRAFGIHVLLGSQTLAGAYSLARSTIGQMAVRIALQCSESDAHLILSEDNTAARLLSRPGEAIYNDANGLLEGNHPFQVVWLNDHQREGFLKQVATLAEKRELATPTPIIFEGNAAADPRANDLLRDLLRAPWPTAVPVAPRAWLGSAVAIKDPTDVTFRRQTGANLLVVGQQEELAHGLLSNAVLSLSAQLPATAERLSNEVSGESWRSFYILDGTRPDAPDAGAWKQLPPRAKVDAEVIPLRDSTTLVERIATEVNRRMAAGDQAAAPIFLVIYNLARFRDLKKGEDFSFDDDAGGNAAKQLATILREGPPLGIHTLIWCDSYNNVTRWLDRQALRDFDARVLFQMNASDSSNLVDSPAAGKLGAHMALAFSEEQGRAEKFRPYGIPSDDWLTWIAERFQRRLEKTVGDESRSGRAGL